VRLEKTANGKGMETKFTESSVYLLGLEAFFWLWSWFFMHVRAQVLNRLSLHRDAKGCMRAFRFCREDGRPSDAVQAVKPFILASFKNVKQVVIKE